MARPQRNNVDYFPFYCEEGKKMYYLEETYGNDGFATFLKILRELAKTDFHYLDLSKNTTRMFLSAKCKVSKQILESIINDLVDLDKFDKDLWVENSIIWCEDFIDSIQDAYSKRSSECMNKEELINMLISKGIRKPSKLRNKPIKGSNKPNKGSKSVVINPQSIEEYSKLNKRKEELLISWLNYRKEIKKPIKNKSTLTLLINKFLDTDEDVIFKVINNTITNNWVGLFWDKVDLTKTKTIPNPSNEELITFKCDQDQIKNTLPKTDYLNLVETMKGGGYTYTIIKQ